MLPSPRLFRLLIRSGMTMTWPLVIWTVVPAGRAAASRIRLPTPCLMRVPPPPEIVPRDRSPVVLRVRVPAPPANDVALKYTAPSAAPGAARVPDPTDRVAPGLTVRVPLKITPAARATLIDAAAFAGRVTSLVSI